MRWLYPFRDDTGALIRRMRRRPANFLYLVLILGVGLGCISGIFDVAYGTLRSALPYLNADRIVVATRGSSLLFSYDQPNPHLESVFEKAAEYKLIDANLDSGAGPKRIRVAMVSPQFFSTLGVKVSVGHDFSTNDEFPIPSSQPSWLPVILSYNLWRTYSASDELPTNKSIELSIPPYRFDVIAIAPPSVSFPMGVDAWVPVHLTSFSLIQAAGVPAGTGGVVGLLKQGLSITAAEAQMQAWPQEGLFGDGQGTPLHLIPFANFQAGDLYTLGLRLWLASVIFFVLTIISVVTLFQTDFASRQAEFAIRRAVGANAGRLLSSFGLEAGMVVLLALVLSLLVRFLLIHIAAAHLPLPKEFQSSLNWIDLTMLGIAAGLVFVSSLIVAVRNLMPELTLSHVFRRLQGNSDKGYHNSRTVHGYRVPLHIVLSTTILITAALLVRSSYKLMHTAPNIRTGNTFICEISLPLEFDKFLSERMSPELSQTERAKAFHNIEKLFREETSSIVSEIIKTLSDKSSVVNAGVISSAPYRGHAPFSADVQYFPPFDVSHKMLTVSGVTFRSISPDAIAALGMTLRYGRNFSGHSIEDENTVIVNEALAEKLGWKPTPLGQQIALMNLPPSRIIGIVRNVHEESLLSQVWPTVYFPLSQYGLSDVDLVIHTSKAVSNQGALDLIRTSVRSVSPGTTVSHFESSTEMVGSAGTLTRYSAYYLLTLALLSIFLAGLSTLSQTLRKISGRRHEIGIRMALGATRGIILRMFVSSSLKRTLIAALLGTLLAWWFARLLSFLFYGVRLFDAFSFFIGIATLVGGAAIAEVLLLRRALQENPRDLLFGLHAGNQTSSTQLLRSRQ